MNIQNIKKSSKELTKLVYAFILFILCTFSMSEAKSTKGFHHKFYFTPLSKKANIDVTVNIMSLGADNTGNKDCSALVRQAQKTGNVYFPKGTYLMSAVDVISNRKYFGDGKGKTIIKANSLGAVRTIFGISTRNYDNSGHPDRNVENVQIADMTLDFNFTSKWIDYFCPIQFKGLKGHFIKNILINNIEFIDNAKRLHANLLGMKGGDAWCINFSSFADSTVDITVKNCVSNAEGHQFVAGGGSVLKRITVSDNYIQKPKANGIAFTTVSADSADFEDFTVTGNTIVDPASSAILFGHDPGSSKVGVGYQTFSGLKVTHNTFILSDLNVYGTSYRNNKSFPIIINLSSGEPYLKDVLVENNNIKVLNSYSGNEIFLGKIQPYSFRRDDTQIVSDYQQPNVNSEVVVSVASGQHMGKSAFTPGGYVGIFNAGVYKVIKADGSNITLQLTDIGSYAREGSRIASGSAVKFIGGILENIQFINNHISGPQQLKILPGGIITNLTATGNNQMSLVMRYPDSFVDKVKLSNNADFDLQITNGNINGTVAGNVFKNQKKPSIAPVKMSTFTGLQEKVKLDIR